MIPDLDEVTTSYHRCMAVDGFIDRFYERFMAKSEEVAKKFQRTDFDRQKLMLRESLLEMLLFNMHPEKTLNELKQLGDLHGRKGADVSPDLYDLWLDALCETVQELDPEYGPQLGLLWRNAMRPGIQLMISRY